MIKAIILDVDGVIVGSKLGYNLPDPHPKVISALKALSYQGLMVSLCTAKPCFSIEKIIRAAHLDNPHITYAGGVIFNPLSGVVLKNKVLDNALAVKLINQSLVQGFYTEFLTLNDDYIQASHIVSGSLAVRTAILLKEPQVVDDLAQTASGSQINNITIAVDDPKQKEAVERLLAPFDKTFQWVWTVHPSTPNWEYAIITTQGITKRRAVEELAQRVGLSLEETLGVGDGLADWEFMEICGYRAAMGNSQAGLIQLVQKSNQQRSYMGPAVDDNGLLDIFEHFGLSY